jgi:hypothetical protein
MSPADFATSLTFSIALAVRLFCCAGLAWSTAATLPAPVVCDAGGGFGAVRQCRLLGRLGDHLGARGHHLRRRQQHKRRDRGRSP